MSRFSTTSTILIAVVALTGEVAEAYELQVTPSGEPVRWFVEQVPTRIDLEGAPVPVELAEAAARRAFATWSAAGAPSLVLDSVSNQLTVRFATDPRDPGVEPGMLALTHLAFDSESGEIFGGDIVVNTYAFAWAASDECANGPASYEYDLESTLAHEIGHALGLRHSRDPEATMSTGPRPCSRNRRDLAPDDVDAIAELYGAGEPDSPGASGCSAGGAGRRDGSGGAVLFALVAAAVWLPARRREASLTR